jgi:hypothetical protein
MAIIFRNTVNNNSSRTYNIQEWRQQPSIAAFYLKIEIKYCKAYKEPIFWIKFGPFKHEL